MTCSIPAVSNASPLLDVRDLHVNFVNGRQITPAVRGVSFQLGQEKLAIVGESGSGKSTVGRALLQLHPAKARIEASRMQFGDIDLLHASPAEMRAIRGKRISMIMQDPISGGQGQRVMIAMMLITEPELVIADEPTSALDVSVRLQVLALLDDLVKARGLGLIFISHDINLVRSFCDRVLVMYAGRVVESLAASELDRAQHPYTQGLLAALPDLDRRRTRLPVLQRHASWLTD
ncbi:MAG: peptide transporter ATP-binding protein [Pantoea agglomerans]|nr:peptide transporter ATP-binding protein [Pantoea agglomerans]